MKDLIRQIESRRLTIEQALEYTYEQGKRDAEKEKLTIWKLQERLKQNLDSSREEILESQYPEDLIHEYIDLVIPIYNHDLVEVLASDIQLGFIENRGLLPKNEELNVFKFITATIYERLSPIGYKWLETNKGE